MNAKVEKNSFNAKVLKRVINTMLTLWSICILGYKQMYILSAKNRD